MPDRTESDHESRARSFHEHVEPEIAVLLRVARTLTGSWADAEDLVQETLIRAYRFVDRFDGRHARAWLLTILRHTNVNMNRRQRPELIADGDVLADHRPAFAAAPQQTPEDVVVDNQLEEHLARAVNALDPKFRQVLVLIDIDQLTYAEAAGALGVPIGTVMSRLHRARDRVRRGVASQLTERNAR